MLSEKMANVNILDISTLDGDETEEQLINENKCFQELQTRKMSMVEAVPQKVNDAQEVAVALIGKEVEQIAQDKQALKQYESEINTSQKGWNRLKSETDLKLLVGLLYDWLETLKFPILGQAHLETVVINYKKTDTCFQKFDIEEACLIEYLLKFLSKIQPITKQDQDDILKRFIAAFAQQTVTIDDSTLPEGRCICLRLHFALLFLVVFREGVQKTSRWHSQVPHRAF